MARRDPDHPYGDAWVKTEFGWEGASDTGRLKGYMVVKYLDRRKWALCRKTANNTWTVAAYFKSREEADEFCRQLSEAVLGKEWKRHE